MGILQALGLQPVSTVQVVTPSGHDTQGVYMCKLGFPGTDIPAVGPMPVIGSQLAAFGHTTLIGRDILTFALLIYDGRHGMWTIAI